MTLSDIIAGIAVFISLISLSISLFVVWRDRVNIVATSNFLPKAPPEFGEADAHLVVKIVNLGRRPAILRLLWLEMDHGNHGRYLGESEQGLRLEENEFHEETLYKTQLMEWDDSRGEMSTCISLSIEDSLGKKHPVKDSYQNIKELLES